MEKKDRLFSKISDEKEEKNRAFEHLGEENKEGKSRVFEHLGEENEEEKNLELGWGKFPFSEKTLNQRRMDDKNYAEILPFCQGDFSLPIGSSSIGAEKYNAKVLENPDAIGKCGINMSGKGLSESFQHTLYSRQNLCKVIPHMEYEEKKKKINIDAANFVYSNGNLTATDNETFESVGNFSLKILEEKNLIDEVVNEANELIGTKKRQRWRVQIIVAGNAEYEGNIESGEIFEIGWIERLTGNRVALSSNLNAKKLLKKYIQGLIQAENYPTITEYGSSGWKWLSSGQVCYLTSQGAIGLGHLPIRAADGFNLITKSAGEQQIFQEYIGMRSIIPGNPGNAVFLQYYVMAALLTALFKKAGYQIEFSTALIGKTNTKKTTCGEIFTRVFNRTASAVPEINFSATEAAIYEIMDRYADTVVMIDDLTPAENDLDAREKNRKLESIIRAYGDRVPRRRSVAFASNSAAKEFTPINGCALITGETFSGGKSSRSRVVILNFEEGDVDNSALSYYQENLYILPNFVDSLLRFVTEYVEQIMRQISQDCVKIRAEMKGKIRLPRYIDAFAVLYSVTNIFGAYIAEKGLLSQEEISNLIENDREALLRIIQENDAAVSNVSPGIMLLESLKFAVNREGIRVKNVAEIGEGKVTDYLIYDENFIYITSEKMWECGRKYADYRRQYFPYKSGRELLTPLKEEGLIFLKREGRSLRATHKITVNGAVINQRFLYIYRSLAEEKLAAAEDY